MAYMYAHIQIASGTGRLLNLEHTGIAGGIKPEHSGSHRKKFSDQIKMSNLQAEDSCPICVFCRSRT